jgi:SAM-dependent methyltransferase
VIDYDAVADLYDSYVQVDFDLPFFREESKDAGEVLELMAGTGRVSAALLDVVPRLTCVDSSREMLARLTRKLSAAAPTLQIVRADIRRLPFKSRYDLALIPFHAFAEITDAHDRLQALLSIREALRPGGRLVCALHNPAVRRLRVDGEEKLLGSFALPDTGGRLEVWMKESYEDASTVFAVQTYRVYGENDELVEMRRLDLRFALIEEKEFVGHAREAGFETGAVYGDYERSSFDRLSSLFMIFDLRISPEFRGTFEVDQ